MICDNWPSLSNYTCEGGDKWTQLENYDVGTYECESLCLKHASDVGCCHMRRTDGCFWKGRANVTRYNTKEAVTTTVACTYSEPGKFSIPVVWN